jgi:hypothetical protein
MALAWAELMRRLGYSRYVAQGGDVGACVTDAMGRQAPEGLVGIHTNLLVPPLARASGPEHLCAAPTPASRDEHLVIRCGLRPETRMNTGFPSAWQPGGSRKTGCRPPGGRVEVTTVRYDGITHDFMMLNPLSNTRATRAAVAQAISIPRDVLQPQLIDRHRGPPQFEARRKLDGRFRCPLRNQRGFVGALS